MLSQRFLIRFCALMILTILGLPLSAPAADKDVAPEKGKVAGILIDKKDNWLTVKADGEDEPVKYVVGKDSDKKLLKALKSIFNASRVQLTYKATRSRSRLIRTSSGIAS